MIFYSFIFFFESQSTRVKALPGARKDFIDELNITPQRINKINFLLLNKLNQNDNK